MSAPWIDVSDEELGVLLVDLGTAVEPGGDAAAMVAARLGRDDRDDRGGRPRPVAPRWLVAAAIVLVAVATILAVAPAREAVARWLGVGAVRIETGAPGATTPSSTVPSGPVDVAALERSLPFDIRLLDPGLAGDPLGAEVDPAVPTGLVEVRYAEVSLIEIASEPGGSPALGKIVGMGTELRPVTVGESDGFWLVGAPHDIAYLAPDGVVRNDTVRRAGNVLLWADGDVTYRIEGAASVDEALGLAASLR